MTKRCVSLIGLLAFLLLLAACSSAPTPAPTRIVAPIVGGGPTTTPLTTADNSDAATASESSFQTESNSGGSVTVDVKPAALSVGKPVAFDVAMNTHSVDLSDDMTKISVLRDDTGKEYQPTTWDGPTGGGHHRSGTLTFPALTNKPKYVELVIKGLAKVPERVFKWDVP